MKTALMVFLIVVGLILVVWAVRGTKGSDERKSASEDLRRTVMDLNKQMIEAATSAPPAGFQSKHKFEETDLKARLAQIEWFANRGKPMQLDLTMEIQQARSWEEAMTYCKSLTWQNATLEAQNQLSMVLNWNDRAAFQANWNPTVVAHKKETLGPLVESKIVPFQKQHGLDERLIHAVQWDILGALMENSFMKSKHSCFFFLELLQVYEAGHFPCGWIGEWPEGKLVLY